MSPPRQATLYRMVMDKHVCPYGLKAKDLLRRGSIPLEQRYYGNARIFRDDELGRLRLRVVVIS